MTQVLDPEVPEVATVAIDPRILERREEVDRQRTRRRTRIAAAVGAVVVVVGGAWAALHSPVLAARHVTVVGAIHTGTGPVVSAVGLNGQPLVDVDLGRAAARVEALPWVAHATVARHWPDEIVVTVDERVPVAAVTSPGHGSVLVDRTGHVLTSASMAPPGTVVLEAPVRLGPPGSVLGAAADPGLDVLTAVPAALRARVERVEVASDGTVTLALTGNIGATFGPAVELGAKFEALLSVLVDVPPRASEDIDVTVPDAPAVGPPAPPAQTVRLTPPPSRVQGGGLGQVPQVQRAR